MSCKPSASKMLWRMLMLMVMMLVLLPRGDAAFGRDECSELSMNSSCQCSRSMPEFEIDCPMNAYSPKLRVTIRDTTDSNVHIECTFTNASEYKIMPMLHIGSIDRVQIQGCPLPGHTPIAGILSHLGIPNPKMLIFESNYLGVNLTRKHLDHLQNVKRLRFTSRSITYIPPDFLDDLQNLTWLELRSNMDLPAQLLSKLNKLEFLELSNNNLRRLPHGFFHNQHKLLHLNLWSNQLRNLSRHDFEGAESVLDVDLSSNGIEQLRHDVFALLTNLTDINLNGNHIRALPEGLFAHNKHLRQVRLINNRVPLVTLPSRLFSNLPELQNVLLRCDLETLPGDLLKNSSGLTNMTLAGNSLSTLPSKLLEHQVNLLSLDLQRNKLSHLPDKLFAHTINLVDLNMADNMLSSIDGDIFARLTNLRTLTISNNILKTIHNEAFISTTQLTHIDLSNNQIDLHQMWLSPDLPPQGSPFTYLLGLETLNLRNNSIMYIYNDWRTNMSNLTLLDLSYNKISYLKYFDFEVLSNRKITINVTHNEIRSIDVTGSLKKAQSQAQYSDYNSVIFDVNNNPLVCDCVQMPLIQVVRKDYELDSRKPTQLNTDHLICSKPNNLAGRSVQDVHPSELLCKLDTTDDPMERRCPINCDCMVRTFDRALIVNCSDRGLLTVPKLPTLPRSLLLMELHLENNAILELPTAISTGYENVTSLHLAGNNLTRIDITQLPMNLTALDLRRNHLQSLNFPVLNFLNRTIEKDSLQLSENPWVCNCSAKDLLIFTQSYYYLIGDRSMMFCSDAEQPTKMDDLTVNDICPDHKRLAFAVGIVISLTGFFIAITIAFYYKYKEEIKIWLYAHNLFLWWVTEEEVDKDKIYDAFISYSQKDSEFVEKVLVPELENSQRQFKLCVHGRNWLVGSSITENIVRSVKDSRRTIIVLSRNFIESDWARMEFSNAHRSALDERRSRVIMILHSDIGDIEKLDSELKAYLKMNTYLKRDDPNFLDRLCYAMPHRRSVRSRRNDGALVKSVHKGSTDDKLELILPSSPASPLTTPPAEATKNPLVAHLNGGSTQTATIIANAKNGHYASNGNGHINGAFIINSNAKQSDV